MPIATDYAITQSLRHYLLPLMIQTFGDQCAGCGLYYPEYEIDHKRYGPDVTMYDLQLLCEDCHWTKTTISNEQHMSRVSHCSTCTCY